MISDIDMVREEVTVSKKEANIYCRPVTCLPHDGKGRRATCPANPHDLRTLTFILL